jgi:hypothetical protein
MHPVLRQKIHRESGLHFSRGLEEIRTYQQVLLYQALLGPLDYGCYLAR